MLKRVSGILDLWMYDDVCVCYIKSMDILDELPTSVFTQIIFNII